MVGLCAKTCAILPKLEKGDRQWRSPLGGVAKPAA
jgi:hypothetical protein